MKHLFLIHSHTVFLTAMGVIEQLGLKNSDVLIMNFRHYHNPQLGFNYKSYDFSDNVEESYHIFFSYSRKHFIFNKKQRNKIVNAFDDFVDNVIQENYTLYVPHLQSPSFQILATNKKCKEVFFVQEGARIMYDCIIDKNKWYYRLYNRLFLRNENRMWKAYNWFPEKGSPFNKPIIVFAFDKSYFGDIPSKTILVSWPKVKIDIQIEASYPIFILEAAVELGQIEKRIYKECVNKLIEECGGKNNYIKFHPQQSLETQKEYLELFLSKGMNVEPLPMDIPFELILAAYKNLTVCGFGSSLLFYAKAFGHKVISLEKDLLISRRYRMYCKNIEKLK